MQIQTEGTTIKQPGTVDWSSTAPAGGIPFTWRDPVWWISDIDAADPRGASFELSPGGNHFRSFQALRFAHFNPLYQV